MGKRKKRVRLFIIIIMTIFLIFHTILVFSSLIFIFDEYIEIYTYIYLYTFNRIYMSIFFVGLIWKKKKRTNAADDKLSQQRNIFCSSYLPRI